MNIRGIIKYLKKFISAGVQSIQPVTLKYTDGFFDIIAVDITRHCNARCFFCFNDWNALSPRNMTSDVFGKCLSLLHFANASSFYCSCLFEPTLHPDFFEFLELIPEEYKDKGFFTTNLIRRISDEEFEIMARANVAHINISVETLDDNSCKKIMGIRKSSFFDNLERMSEVFKKAKHPPAIRFITMVLKENKTEITGILRKTKSLFPDCYNELRTPYFFMHDDGRTLDEKSLLSEEEILKLQKELDEEGFGVRIEKALTAEAFRNILLSPELENIRAQLRDGLGSNYAFRINADGTGHFDYKRLKFDLNNIDDPHNFFKDKLRMLHEVHAQKGKKFTQESKKSMLMLTHIDSYNIELEKWLVIKGWVCIPKRVQGVRYVIADLKSGFYFPAEINHIKDFHLPFLGHELQRCGFICRISLSDEYTGLPLSSYVAAGYIDEEKNTLFYNRLRIKKA